MILTEENRNLNKQKSFDWGNPADQLVKPEQWHSITNYLNLTNREIEVCKQLFLGLTRTEIATSLGIKPRTSRQYVEQLHEKMRVTGRVGLVLRVVQVRDHLFS